MRTKLALVLALSRRPELMILDEPGEGLDPIAVQQVLECVVKAAAGHGGRGQQKPLPALHPGLKPDHGGPPRPPQSRGTIRED